MSDLLSARGQMTMSLAFHIVFAVAGMAMPLFMFIADALHLKTNDPIYEELSLRWAKGTAILFAVGAVSGTVLSFELGLLWPGFMQRAGPLVGLPFTLEGVAFFVEAIFLGLFLYGRKRMDARLHLFTAAMVAVSGLASGVLVMAVNAWMHTPTGFTVDATGAITNFEPWAAFSASSFPTQAVHMALAAYVSVSFLVLGIHCFALKRNSQSVLHKRAAAIALGIAFVFTPLQILSGDLSAKHLAEHQPIKLAAFEAHFQTEKHAALSIGGWPNAETRRRDFSIDIPYGLSILAFGDPNAEVKGLEEFPEDEWPPLAITHLSFQLMVACGVAMLAVLALAAFLKIRKISPTQDSRFQTVTFFAAPLGLIALEAGWVSTEVGRQPWIIRGYLKVADAVTPVPHLWLPFLGFSLLYLVLGVITVKLLSRHVFRSLEPDV